MTIPYERARAVLYTERFLKDLLNPQITPKVPKPIRRMAGSLLRHYPSEYDLEKVEMHWGSETSECPFQLNDPFKRDGNE
jgi:hypothetical protein